MRVCPSCNQDVNDDKAVFCPQCGTPLQKQLKNIKTTILPRIGSLLLLIGVLTFIVATLYDLAGFGYGLSMYGLPALVVFGFSLISIIGSWIRRWYGSTVGAAAFTLFLEFMIFGARLSALWVDALPLGFFLTLSGVIIVTASRQEFS